MNELVERDRPLVKSDYGYGQSIPSHAQAKYLCLAGMLGCALWMGTCTIRMRCQNSLGSLLAPLILRQQG